MGPLFIKELQNVFATPFLFPTLSIACRYIIKPIPLSVYFTTKIMVLPFRSPLKLIFASFLFTVAGALTSSGQDLYTADGILLGNQKVFIDACVQGAQEKTIDVKGVKFNMERYCSCMATELMPRLNSDAIIAAVEQNNMEKLGKKRSKT